MARNKSIKEHRREVAKFENEVREAVSSGFAPYLPDGSSMSIPGYDVPIYNQGIYESGFGDRLDQEDPIVRRAGVESSMCGCDSGLRGGVLMGTSSTMLDYSQDKFEPVNGAGTDGLGYAVWGPGNALPILVYRASSALPYTASALDYLDRTFFGLGARVVYIISRYSGGTVTHEEVDYRDAGTYIKEYIISLTSKLAQLTAPAEGSDTLVDGMSSVITVTGSAPVESVNYNDKLIERYEKLLDEANASLERYYTDRARIDAMLENNNISFFLKSWIADTVRYGICFPICGLSRSAAGKWTPEIVSFEMRDASVMRFEQRNPSNLFKIDYVYYSERWREDPKGALGTGEYVAYPNINPEHPLSDLRQLVSKNHRTKVGERPYWFCYPSYTHTPTKPYYPQLPWWSIFPSQVYQYASTVIYDKATARKNSTMWGKILFINTAYLAQIFAQAGEKGKTAEGQKEIRKGIYNSVENFLKRRDNNGKLLVMDSYPSADEKIMIDSIRIVDVPRSDDVKASASEVAEMASLVSYSLGVNMSLVGSSPSLQNQGTGTAQRELHLLKNGQLSPDRVTFTDFFNNFIFRFNDIDRHFQVRLFYPTLTTLDNSKTGTVEQTD